MNFLIAYMLLMNFATFCVMGVDKQYAKRKDRRIPEKRIFLLALIGGAAGVWLGMRVWRHKTLHASFTVGIPLLFAVNVICVWLLASGRLFGL